MTVDESRIVCASPSAVARTRSWQGGKKMSLAARRAARSRFSTPLAGLPWLWLDDAPDARETQGLQRLLMFAFDQANRDEDDSMGLRQPLTR
jgi:hypothetical protein